MILVYKFLTIIPFNSPFKIKPFIDSNPTNLSAPAPSQNLCLFQGEKPMSSSSRKKYEVKPIRRGHIYPLQKSNPK